MNRRKRTAADIFLTFLIGGIILVASLVLIRSFHDMTKELQQQKQTIQQNTNEINDLKKPCQPDDVKYPDKSSACIDRPPQSNSDSTNTVTVQPVPQYYFTPSQQQQAPAPQQQTSPSQPPPPQSPPPSKPTLLQKVESTIGL